MTDLEHSPAFNLLDEPWLPCVMAADGQARELSLRDTLTRAHEIRELADPSPLVTVALHRLLLAVLHRNFGPKNAPQWAALWQAGQFDAATLDRYFDQWRPRFNLFDAERPFYQTPEVEFAYAKPIATMVYGLTLGNYVTLFDHTTESQPVAMRPADAARNLVGFQAFALGGLVSLRKGEPTGEFKSADAAPLTKGAVTLVGGASLFQTLMLNLVRYAGDAEQPFAFEPDADQPAWERDAHTRAEDRQPGGYLDLLTWQSRRMRLRPSSADDGSVVVREAVIMKGNQFPSDFQLADSEPMLAFRKVAKPSPGQAPWLVLPFRRDRALWRDSQALFDATSADSVRPRTLDWLGLLVNRPLEREQLYDLDVLGMSIDRANVFFWRHERLPLPLDLLANADLVERVKRALRLSEEVGQLFRAGVSQWTAADGKAVKRPRPLQLFAETMLAPSGSRQPDRAAVDQFVASLQAGQSYWARLELAFTRFIEALGRAEDDGVAALSAWALAVRVAAQRAFADTLAGFDTSAHALKAAALADDAFGRQLGIHMQGWGVSRKEELDAVAP